MPLALIGILPALIGLAEKLLPKHADGTSSGPEKKSLVMRLLEVAWDALEQDGKLPPAVAAVGKKTTLAILSSAVDAIVAAVKSRGQAPAA